MLAHSLQTFSSKNHSIGYSFGEDWEMMSVRASRYGTLQVAYGADGCVMHASPGTRHSTIALHRVRWKNYHYFFEKHSCDRSLAGRLVLRWWELSESYAWLRNEMGLPWKSGGTASLSLLLLLFVSCISLMRFACS